MMPAETQEELRSERETIEKLKAEIANHSSIDCVMCKLLAEREASRKLVGLLAEAFFFWGQFPEFKFDFATHGWERFEKWKDETKAVLKEATPGHSPEGETL